MRKTISVIIPTYNRSAYIVDCVESVLTQTYPASEIIVSDDGSTDDTKERLQPWIASGQIQFLQGDHSGAAAARNRGIEASSGDLVSFLDSDDVFLLHILEKQAAYFEAHPDAMILVTDFDKFDNQGNHLGTRVASFYQGHIYPHILEYWETLIGTSTVMVDRRIFDKVGLFDERLSFGEDLELWARIARQFPFHYLPESLARVRVHGGNTSFDKASLAERHLPYLHTAVAADPNLGKATVRRIYGKMYGYMGLNMLATGDKTDMINARNLFAISLRYYLFQPYVWAGVTLSVFGKTLRSKLGSIWRRWRDAWLMANRTKT